MKCSICTWISYDELDACKVNPSAFGGYKCLEHYPIRVGNSSMFVRLIAVNIQMILNVLNPILLYKQSSKLKRRSIHVIYYYVIVWTPLEY